MENLTSFELLLNDFPALTLMPLVHKANRLAEKRHHGQFRKNRRPQLSHLHDVLRTLLTARVHDNECLAGGILHDIMEENWPLAPTILNELNEQIGSQVTQIVLTLTDDPDLDRETRFAQQLKKMVKASQKVRIIKLADRLSVLSEPGLSPSRWEASANHASSMLRVISEYPSTDRSLDASEYILTCRLCDMLKNHTAT